MSSEPQRTAVATRRPGEAAVTRVHLRTVGREAAPSWDFSKIPVSSSGSDEPQRLPPPIPAPRLPIQTKLEVGAVDDPLEHEADRVANQVMRMPAPEVSVTAAPPEVSRKCEECEEEEEKEELQEQPAPPRVSVASPQLSRRCADCENEETLQRKSAGPQAASEAPASVHQVLRSPGQPLDAATRAFFEPRFGHDFSSVRVHIDAPAAESARDVKAHAYTVGRDMVFGAGRFAPRTVAGQRLLAHELAHILQQANKPPAGSERSADMAIAASAQTLRRQPVSDVAPRTSALIARLTGSELLDGFALNGAALTADHKGRLRILAHTLKSLLREYPGGSVQITGHTDASGDEKFNERLGQQRADAVGDFLLDAGVPPSAIATLSAGESALRVQTERPEPRNRRAEVRFETEPRGKSLMPPEPAPEAPPGESKGVPRPERLCVDQPELAVCQPESPPTVLSGLELPTRCTSDNCSAIAVHSFARQPPDLQRVLIVSFPSDPARWFDRELDHERRGGLTSIYNRLCQLGLWCHVRKVLNVHAGEAPVSIGIAKFNVPGLSVSVDLETDDNKALLDALVTGGANCIDTGVGGMLHSGQTSVRQISTSDSLHVAVGSGNLSDAHVDLYASVTSRGESVPCQYNPAGTAAHLGREILAEKLRGLVRSLTGWMKFGPLPILRDVLRTVTSGVQIFPDSSLTPTVPQPEPVNRQDAVPPPLVGITWRGPVAESRQPEAKRVGPDVRALSVDVVNGIQSALDKQVSPEALFPPQVRARLAELRKAAETAGPDEEAALNAALEREADYADAHDVAFDLAERMERARRAHQSWVKLELDRYGRYGELDGNGRRAIVGELQRIALILRDHLTDRAAGVNTIVLIFGSDNLAVREEIRLPGWVAPEKGIFD